MINLPTPSPASNKLTLKQAQAEATLKHATIGWIGKLIGEGEHAKNASVLLILIALMITLWTSPLTGINCDHITGLIGVAIGYYISKGVSGDK